jgi:curved DNA-binding protein CbpA
MLTRAARLAALAARGAVPCCARRAALRALATQAPRDPYAVLGVSRSATLEEVKAAYRREALKWHPDRHPEAERDAASARFKAVSEAYQTLSDASSRSRHDSRSSYEQATRGEPGWGRDTARAGGASAGGRAWSDAQQGRGGFTEADAERLFREVFGSASGLAEVLRQMQAAQGAGMRSSRGASSFEDLLGQAMRGAASGARTEVATSVYVRPDGERVVRTTTTTTHRDGRVTQRVEERSMGRTTRGAARSGRAAQAEAAAPEEYGAPERQGLLRDAFKQLLGPFIAAAGSMAAQAATRTVVSFAGAALRAVIRRLLGGR